MGSILEPGRIGAPLRHAAFRRLAGAYALDELAYGLSSVALAVLVYDRTNSALATTALFLAAMFVPAFLAPALTTRAEGLGPRRALTALYLAEALVFALLALTPHAFSLPVVLALALVDGTIAVSARALTRAATVAVLEPRGALREGNALINVVFGLSFAAGPALGALVVTQWSVTVALVANAVAFAVVAGLLAAAPAIPGVRPEQPAWRERLRSGIGHVRQNRLLRLLVAGQALALVFFTLIVPIEVVYAKESLHGGSGAYGALLSAWGAGTLVGSLSFARVRRRSLGALALVATAMVGAAYLAMAAAGTVVVACAACVVGGAGNGVQSVAVLTAVQESTPGELQARVMGLFESVGAAAPGAGFLLGGLLTAAVDPRAAFLVAGAGVAGLVLVALLVGPRVRRRAANEARHRSEPSPPAPATTATASEPEGGRPRSPAAR